MAIFDRFRSQPEWKHADPAIRAAAVRKLGSQDHELLVSLARSDADAQVRRVALRKLGEPALLAEAAQGDTDAGVREDALDGLVELAVHTREIASGETALRALSEQRHLGRVAKEAVLPELKQAACERLTNARALAAVVRTSEAPALRLLALGRIQEPDVLAELALKCEHKDAALAALERISDTEALEAIASRGRHKAAARRARVLLDARPKPTVVAPEPVLAVDLHLQRRLDLVAMLGDLLTAPDAETADKLRAAEAAWKALETQPAEELERQYLEAVAALRGLIERQRSDVDATQHSLEQAARDSRSGFLLRLEGLRGADLLAAREELRQQWAELPALPGADVEIFGRRFDAVFTAAERAAQDSEAHAAEQTRALALVTEIEPLAEIEDLREARRRFVELDRSFSTLRPDVATRERRDRVAARLAERQAHAQAKRDEEAAANRVRLVALAERMESLARTEDPSRREAERALREAREAIDKTGHLASKQEREEVVARLKTARQALYGRVQELKDADEWKQWANVGVQEDLCARVEALLEVQDLALASRRLQEAEDQWKQARQAPRDKAEALWTRFKTTRDTVRARCDAFFTQQRAERAENQRQKEALCLQAEALADSTDWVKTAETLRKLQADWQQIGPAPQTKARVLWERFRGACNRFFERRKQDLEQRTSNWNKNLALKEALCVSAEALAESTDWTTTAAEIKRLQAEWKKIGPVRKNRSEQIWKRFRAACDRFFERYGSREQKPKPPEQTAVAPAPASDDPSESSEPERLRLAGRMEALSAEFKPRPVAADAAALVSQLREALAHNTIGGRADDEARWKAAATEVRSLHAEWSRLAPLAGEAGKALEERFKQASQRFHDNRPRS